MPTYNDNITATGTKLARVIERPRDFEATISLDTMNDEYAWALHKPSLSQLSKVFFF